MNNDVEKNGNDFTVKPDKGFHLTEQQRAFAANIGFEVDCGRDGIGINLGLYFPDVWAEDGIIAPNGVNVFFPELNKIIVLNFGQVELIIPEVKKRKIEIEILKLIHGKSSGEIVSIMANVEYLIKKGSSFSFDSAVI